MQINDLKQNIKAVRQFNEGNKAPDPCSFCGSTQCYRIEWRDGALVCEYLFHRNKMVCARCWQRLNRMLDPLVRITEFVLRMELWFTRRSK